MQYPIPDDELADMQIAAHSHLDSMNNVNTHWLQMKLMEAFVAGAKHQYQEERKSKSKKSTIPTATWFAAAACIFIISMPFHRSNVELICFFTLSMVFAGMMLLAFLIEKRIPNEPQLRNYSYGY